MPKIGTARKNRTKMWYSNQIPVDVPVYAKDSDGNVIYDTIDGVSVPRETGSYTRNYTTPKLTWASMTMSNTGNWTDNYGNAKVYQYGISIADYDATILASRDEFDWDETTVLWVDHEPEYIDEDETIPNTVTADFRVRRVAKSVNQISYLLRRIE